MRFPVGVVLFCFVLFLFFTDLTSGSGEKDILTTWCSEVDILFSSSLVVSGRSTLFPLKLFTFSFFSICFFVEFVHSNLSFFFCKSC